MSLNGQHFAQRRADRDRSGCVARA